MFLGFLKVAQLVGKWSNLFSLNRDSSSLETDFLFQKSTRNLFGVYLVNSDYFR